MMGFPILVIEMLEDFNKQLVYSDSHYRLEYIDRAPISRCGLPALYLKNGLLERRSKLAAFDTCLFNAHISKVIIKEIDSVVIVNYLVQNNNDGRSFELSVPYIKP
jgi:hypothetical protein